MIKMIFLITIISFSSLAKRIAPEVIKPIISHGYEYTFEVEYIDCKNKNKTHQCAMHVYVLGKDIGAEKTIWKQMIYQIRFNPEIETDVQTVFPMSLILQDGLLKAVDDRGAEYIVNAKNGKLQKPKNATIYNKI